MNEYKLSCPHCGQRIAYDESHVGLSVHCPTCQQVIVVPSSEGVPSAAPPSLAVAADATAPETGTDVVAQPGWAVPRMSARAVTSLALALTIVAVGLLALGVRKWRHAPTVENAPSGVSKPAETVPDSAPADPPRSVLASPAEVSPIDVKLLSFTPKTAGKKAGFTLRLENRSGKPVSRLMMGLEYRDADGVLENSVPYTHGLGLEAHAHTEDEHGDSFMSELTRSVTFTVEAVVFADGSQWSRTDAALAGMAPGALSFADHDSPANVEVVRFRPNEAGQGSVSFRLINRSNRAISRFEIEATYLDAAGHIVQVLLSHTGTLEDAVPYSQRFGPGMEIPPGGKYENDPFFRIFQADKVSDKARSVRLALTSVSFLGGEQWHRPGKK